MPGTSSMFLVAAVVIVLASVALAAIDNDLTDGGWAAFKQRYNRNFGDATSDNFRRAIREIKLKAIIQHNNDANKGLSKFTMKENKFVVMKPDEYRKLLGYKSLAATQGHRRRRQIYVPWMPTYTNTVAVSSLPTSVNWTATGWVGPVLDQGYYCGSCWAYTSAGALQAQYKNKTNTFIALSPQHLIDCTGPQGNLGCDGGAPVAAFLYVQTTGIEALASYPTTPDESVAGPCSFTPSLSKTKIISWRDISNNNELALQQAVALVGPVAVAIDASQDSFMFYSSGILSDPLCDATYLNHAVLVVGYGVAQNGDKYWIVKNSWGTEWGMSGYFLLARNSNNMCGVAAQGAFPVL